MPASLDTLKSANHDQQVGNNIVKRALEEPLRWIAQNAGSDGAIVVQKVREMKSEEGYNAATDTYEDLVKAGVIDPTKVARTALQNASSIASLLLTTEAMITEIPEKKEAMPAAAPAAPAAWAGCTEIRLSPMAYRPIGGAAESGGPAPSPFRFLPGRSAVVLRYFEGAAAGADRSTSATICCTPRSCDCA